MADKTIHKPNRKYTKRSPAKPRAAALRAGELTYISGKECPKGHNGERYSKSGKCVLCAQEQTAAQVECGYYKRVYEKRGEDYRARAREAYEANRPARIESAARWAAANPERRRAIANAYKGRRRAQEEGGISGPELAAWTREQKKVCYWCGSPCAGAFEVDHYVPLAKGGEHSQDNLVIACPQCNRNKSARDPIDFAHRVGRLF